VGARQPAQEDERQGRGYDLHGEVRARGQGADPVEDGDEVGLEPPCTSVELYCALPCHVEGVEIPRSLQPYAAGKGRRPTYCRAMREQGKGSQIEAIVVAEPAQGQPESAMKARVSLVKLRRFRFSLSALRYGGRTPNSVQYIAIFHEHEKSHKESEEHTISTPRAQPAPPSNWPPS
jgi:hypothetical protein